MNLNFIFYGFFLVTQCYGMDSWGPLNHELSPFASHNQADHQIRRAVPAEERLTLIKDKMAQNNEFTKDTVVPELSGYYERDLAFIFQEIQCHSNAWFITQQLCQMDQWVKGEFGTENLSHAQYAYFGYMWASLLSKYTFQELEEARLYGKYYLNKTWFMHACNQSMDDFQGIPLLHVSKVGLTPVSVLNEGLGFYDSFGKPQMALFFGVATNESVSFDDFEDETSVKLFYHDIRHANYAFFTECNPVFNTYIQAIASLRNALNQLNINSIEKNEVEWAFYNIFHELDAEDILTKSLTQHVASNDLLRLSLGELWGKYKNDDGDSEEDNAEEYIDMTRHQKLSYGDLDQISIGQIESLLSSEYLMFDDLEKEFGDYLVSVFHLWRGEQLLGQVAHIFDNIYSNLK